MSFTPRTGSSSPAPSNSESELDIGTPLTNRSILFGEEVQHLSLSGDDQYILVIGGLGYIGSHTVWELAKQGLNVIIVDDCSNSFEDVFGRLNKMVSEHFKYHGNRPSLQFFKGDYRDIPFMRTILASNSRAADAGEIDVQSSNQGQTGDGRRSKISGVVDFAGYKAVGESIQQPLKYYANNVGGLIDLCSLLSEFGIKRFVFSSSATVYGSKAGDQGRFSENHCVHSVTATGDGNETIQPGCFGLTNPYGRTKWMSESILNDIVTSDPEWTVFALRYFNPVGCDESALLGEGPRGVPSNLMPVVARVLTGDSPSLNVFGTDWATPDGTAIRDFIHVTDLAKGHIAALTAAATPEFQGRFRTFNLGSGSGHSVLEVVSAMEAASGREVVINAVDRRGGDVAVCVADPRRAWEELHWKTEKSLETCCNDICRYLGIGNRASHAGVLSWGCSLNEKIEKGLSVVAQGVAPVPS